MAEVMTKLWEIILTMILSLMIKRIWFLICFLLFLGGNTYTVFAQDLAFPHLTFSPFVISTTEEPGPFYTATPGTLPRRDIYIGARYIYSDFKTFWGVDLDELFGQRNDPLSGANHVDFTHQVLQFAVAYGITDRLLLGTIVPRKQVFFERTWEGSEVREPGGFNDENEGIGDVVVSTRYQILEELDENPFSWTVGIDIKLPTGDERKVRVAGEGVGTGETDYKALTMLSKRFRKGTAYCSLGYNREGRDKRLDTLEYNLALVFPITKSFSISGEFLGVSWVNWEAGSDFGGIVDMHNLNTYDAGLGVKFRAKGMILELGLTYPLNDDYTRTRLQPAIGINYVF